MKWTPAPLLGAVMGVLWAGSATAYDQLVEKHTFEMPEYTTVGGETIPEVRVGWEAYGTLNAARNNVILIPHFFSGTSHAAGRYVEDGPTGYWHSIIGPGKPIDTDDFYVISSDTLVNLNVHDPNVVTTGPASLNPATGEPWGMDFPIVTIRDMVNVQKALLNSLGIDSLHAVIGASMGALQAIEWAAAYPDMVERVVPVIPGAEADAWLIGWLNLWGAPIKLDPNWQGGDYYDGEAPIAGLTEALKLVTLQARHWGWADSQFGRSWAEDGADPAAAHDNLYAVEAWLNAAAASRAALSDANHFLYLVKANQTFRAGMGATLEAGLDHIEAEVMIVPAEGDQIFPPVPTALRLYELLAEQGTPVQYHEVADQGLGHLDGIVYITDYADELAAFLAD